MSFDTKLLYVQALIVCWHLFTYNYCFCQKHDYNYLNRSTPYGSGISLEYSDSLQDFTFRTFEWSGTVSGSPILSSKDGDFLGYFNCRNLYDSLGRIAINADSMAVGFFQKYLFSSLPEDEGLGNGGNSAFIPINDSLFYLFYKSSELWIGAPNFAINFEENGHRLSSYSDGLYLSKVRLNKQGRLYINEDEKHIKLVDELFQYKNLMFCKHANGIDWWLLVPRALDNEACLFHILSGGQIEQLENVIFSENYWRVRSTSEFVFSPNGKYLARIIIRPIPGFKHIFELFSFDRCDGSVESILVDSLPLAEKYTSGADVEFSENGRFLYLALGSIILQMDLEDPEFFNNRDTIAQWDGYLYFSFLEPIFDALWRLPNGKILVASAVSTPFLHYIHKPNLKAEACLFEERAIMLPDDPLNKPYGVDIEALPRFPPYRMLPLDESCSTSIYEVKNETISLYPNPTQDNVILLNANGFYFKLLNLEGYELLNKQVPEDKINYELSLEGLMPGFYVLIIMDINREIVVSKKLIKM